MYQGTAEDQPLADSHPYKETFWKDLLFYLRAWLYSPA